MNINDIFDWLVYMENVHPILYNIALSALAGILQGIGLGTIFHVQHKKRINHPSIKGVTIYRVAYENSRSSMFMIIGILLLANTFRASMIGYIVQSGLALILWRITLQILAKRYVYSAVENDTIDNPHYFNHLKKDQ